MATSPAAVRIDAKGLIYAPTGRSSPPPPHRCRRPREESATMTTGSRLPATDLQPGVCTPWGLTGRPTTSSTSLPNSPSGNPFAHHVWHRRREGVDGIHARPSLGLDGARPVRIGNGAWDQRQHDVWGVLLDSVYLHVRSRIISTTGVGRCSNIEVDAALPTGGIAIRAFGRCGACREHFTGFQSAVLGSRWIEVQGSLNFAGKRMTVVRWRRAADEIATRMSASTGSMSAGCSASTTTRRRWTHRPC